MHKIMLAIAMALNCRGQETGLEAPRHLDRDLHGPRIDLDYGFLYSIPSALEGGRSSDPASGAISTLTLRHKIPKSARRAFDRAAKCSSRRNYQAAAAELEKAVTIDPDFVEARANLGAQYVRLGRINDAGRELQRVLERDSNIAEVHTNLVLVFLQQNNDRLAVTHGRIAVTLAPSSCPAHFNLGLALGRSPSTLPESLEQLRIAAQRLPAARLELTRLEMLLSRMN